VKAATESSSSPDHADSISWDTEDASSYHDDGSDRYRFQAPSVAYFAIWLGFVITLLFSFRIRSHVYVVFPVVSDDASISMGKSKRAIWR
jgi:hypothetical protein